MALTIRKRGKIWHARGVVPARQADGSIARVRHEESLRTESKAEARKRADQIERYYREQAYGDPKKRCVSFGEAALTYLQTRGKHDRFLPRLLTVLADVPIDQIDQAKLAEVCERLYSGCKASTLNRAVYAPVITILRLSGVQPQIRHPKIQRTQIDIPPDNWLENLLPHCEAQLAALLIFLAYTGRRITEALEATYNVDGTVTVGRTKSGVSMVVPLPDMVADYLGDSLVVGERLWAYRNRWQVYKAIHEVCERARLPYYGSHAIGRHAFATRLLREGYNTFTVAKMGGWASTRMVEYHYGHLAHDETNKLLTEAQERWSKKAT